MPDAQTSKTNHLTVRGWPAPRRPWLMRMNWHDLLFMHWPVDAEQIQNQLPQGLKVDLFQGQAWIGIVPFWMSGVGVRWTPNLPYLSRFPELNVRTYVTIDKKPGVWFFSLDATNPIAVRGARYLFHLPYMDAKISVQREAQWIHYNSDRTHRGQPSARLGCEYRPLGCEFEAEKDTLVHWLTARYCMYMSDSKSRIFRGEIDHTPWRLRDAQAIVHYNTMTDWLGIDLPETPAHLPFCISDKSGCVGERPSFWVNWLFATQLLHRLHCPCFSYLDTAVRIQALKFLKSEAYEERQYCKVDHLPGH